MQWPNKIQQLSLAAQYSDNNYRYQNDPELQTIADNASGSSATTVTTDENTQDLSKQFVVNTFLPISAAAMETSTSSGIAVINPTAATDAKNLLNAIDNANKNHSWGITASDSLFANYNFMTMTDSNYTIDGVSVDPVFNGQPTLHNDYFDFGNFFNPTSLSYADTDGGTTSAVQYMGFLTGNYQPVYAKIIDLDTLNHTISTANQSDASGATAATIVRKLVTSDAFQNIQNAVRQNTAQKSVGMYALDQIFAERAPITSADAIPELDTLAANMGITVTKNSNDEYVYPSKAQVEYFQANHDLNNSQWYKDLQTLSGPNVERETLITLKQIQQSMAQQHADNETIEALLAVSNIQGAQTAAMSLIQDKQTIATWLSSIDYDSISSPDDSSAANQAASS